MAKPLKIQHYQVAPDLYLHRLPVPPATTPTRPVTGLHHVLVVDCSGSMTESLDLLRTTLKHKLPSLLHDGDLITVLWFSGRTEHGVVVREESVVTLRDLARVSAAIDTLLRPRGLTGFVEPLEAVRQVIQESYVKDTTKPCALFFMSDGMDNQWSAAEILAAADRLKPLLVASTFVEYGEFADRATLNRLAAATGGQAIHCASFEAYEPALIRAVTQPSQPARREVAVPRHAVGQVAFQLTRGDLIQHDTQTGWAQVSVDTEALWYLARAPEGVPFPARGQPGALREAQYAAMALFAHRMQPDVVHALLRDTGDVKLIRQFAHCFGKQDYARFTQAALAAAIEPTLRLTQGCDRSLVPDDDALSVLEVLQVIAADPTAKLLLDDPSFTYRRITRHRVDADTQLGPAERAQLDQITRQLAQERDVTKLRALRAQIDQVVAHKRDALAFTPQVALDGYAVEHLTFHENSPNVSVLVKKTGTVDLSARLAQEGADSRVPALFPTFIYRNYAIVAHGVVHVATLPVDLSKTTYRVLAVRGAHLFDNERGVTCVDLASLPVISRKMVQQVTAQAAGHAAYALVQARAEQKVYNDYAKRWPDAGRGTAFPALYGEAGARWLADQGLTELGGFNPRRAQAPVTDYVLGKELTLQVKGHASLPSVDQVRSKVAARQTLNGPERMMARAMLEAETFLHDQPKQLHAKWVLGKRDVSRAQTRARLHQVSQVAFGIIVGQTWFTDLKTLDDDVVQIHADGHDHVVQLQLREVKVEL